MQQTCKSRSRRIRIQIGIQVRIQIQIEDEGCLKNIRAFRLNSIYIFLFLLFQHKCMEHVFMRQVIIRACSCEPLTNRVNCVHLHVWRKIIARREVGLFVWGKEVGKNFIRAKKGKRDRFVGRQIDRWSER